MSETPSTVIETAGASQVPWDQRLARIAARVLARTPLTPNMMTSCGLISGLGGAWLLASGDPARMNAGAALFMLAVWLDHLDGELARATNRSSRFGHYFDHAAALISNLAFFIGAGVGLSATEGDGAIMIAFVAGAALIGIFSVRHWAEWRKGPAVTRQRVWAGFEIEDLLYLTGPVTWAGGLWPFLIAAAAGAPAFLLWIIARAIRDGS